MSVKTGDTVKIHMDESQKDYVIAKVTDVRELELLEILLQGQGDPETKAVKLEGIESSDGRTFPDGVSAYFRPSNNDAVIE